jgi:hypothetical protein
MTPEQSRAAAEKLKARLEQQNKKDDEKSENP